MKDQTLEITKDQSPDAAVLSKALYYAQFVSTAVAYYKSTKDLPNPVKSPTQSQYTDFPSGYTLVANILMKDFFGLFDPVYFGFIASDNANPTNIVVAIRGTQGTPEWVDDFQTALTPCPFAPNAGNVETGFLDLYRSLDLWTPGGKSKVINLAETASNDSNSLVNLDKYKQVTMIGHSLGSSLVTLYGLDMAANNKNKEVVIYTLASPSTGDQAFVDYYNSVITESYRIYNKQDVVPKSLHFLNPKYEQVSQGIELDSNKYPEIKPNIGCWHSLYTYLFLLGAPASILDPACTTLVQS
jgi:hypothetical protein